MCNGVVKGRSILDDWQWNIMSPVYKKKGTFMVVVHIEGVRECTDGS